MWFETHAHLSDAKFDADRDQAIERARAAGVCAIVEIADGPPEWPKARALAERFPNFLRWAAGLHPYYADQDSSAVWEELKRFRMDPRFVAVGEIGLDYAKCPIPPDQQKRAFENGLAASQEMDRPVIIHCREAYPDLLPILKYFFAENKKNAPPGVVHCFSGSRADAEAVLNLGFFLGVDGPVTYPSATSLRETLIAVPLDRIVLETDSPYLPPQTHRGQRNEPHHLPAIGMHLAALRGITPKALAAATSQNAARLFRLNPISFSL